MNDKKGTVRHDNALELDTYFASGSKGHNVRADGRGGTLQRGYYGQTPTDGILAGPHTCRKDAMQQSYFVRRSRQRAKEAKT